MPKAILLTEESVKEFAEVTGFTEVRLLEALAGNPRYILVKNLDPKVHWSTWMFMDDHYFRSLWVPESEIIGTEYVNVRLTD